MQEALERVNRVLSEVPLIDGHNDLPYAIREKLNNRLYDLDLSGDNGPVPGLMTDIKRIKDGKLGGQFWSCYVSCKSQHRDALKIGLEQIDLIRRIVAKHSDVLEFVDSADGIMDAFRRGKVASLIGVEGAHIIDSSLGALRIFHSLGVRYVTLTHNGNTPFAESCIADKDASAGKSVQRAEEGLTAYGERVIREMNRLGVLVDLAHTSKRTQLRVIEVSKAPVIYSHSSVYALCDHARNVHDDVIQRVRETGGLIMVNGNPPFVSSTGKATVRQLAEHADYILKVAGEDYVGIGGDFDGINDVCEGFEDVSKYPNLLVELVHLGWTDEQLRKFAGLNLIRVFKEVERVRDEMRNELPDETQVPPSDMEKHLKIYTMNEFM